MELRLALRYKDEFTRKFNMSNIQNMNIAGQPIGTNYKPYIIAEMSANHNGSIDRAFKIIDEAKKAGADAVKLQTYTPDTITLNCDKEDFQITDGLWKGQTLYELYKDAHMPWDWHKPLFEHAREIDITIFSSPFDESAVDLLEDLNVPAAQNYILGYALCGSDGHDGGRISKIQYTKQQKMYHRHHTNLLFQPFQQNKSYPSIDSLSTQEL